jgi:glucan biosynthesis protein C
MYLMVFVLGFELMSDAGYQQSLERNRWAALISAASCTAIDFTLSLRGVRFAEPSAGFIMLGFANSAAVWFWLIAILGFGQRHLNVENSLLRYTREAAYPFYVLHQTVIVAFGFFVVRTGWGVLPKFFLIATGSFIATVGLYDTAVRRANLTRLLFGLKMKVAGTHPVKIAPPDHP